MKLLATVLAGLLVLAGFRARAQQATYDPADTAQVRITQADYQKMVLYNYAIFKAFSAEVHTSGGYGVARYDALNTLLASQQLPTLANSQLTAGFGFNVRLQRVVFGIEGTIYDTDAENAGYRLKASSATFMPCLGYLWFTPTYAHAFGPLLGVGLNALDLTATGQSQTGAGTAAGLLASQPYARTLHYQNTNLLLGAQYHWLPFDGALLKRCQLGVQVQYLLRLGDGRYYADDPKQSVPGPACDPLLFSLRAVLGFCL